MLKEQQIEKVRKTLGIRPNALPDIFGALSDDSRYRIVRLLLENKGLCVTDISRILGISVPAVSQHFKILETAGVVLKERKGQMVCYIVAIQNPSVKALTKLMVGEK